MWWVKSGFIHDSGLSVSIHISAETLLGVYDSKQETCSSSANRAMPQ